MQEVWNPTQEELGLIAATIPLIASVAVVKRMDGQIVVEWAAPDATPLENGALAALLPLATGALGPPNEEPTMTLSTSTRTAVITGLDGEWTVVFGFKEAVSFDWASYYVRRALGLMRRR